MLDAGQLIEELRQAIKSDALVMPTLPEVAYQVRDTASDPDASVNQLVKVIEQDVSISARLIRVANSPLYRGAKPNDDLKSAINRLGLKLTSSLVTSLAMEQMFKAESKEVDARMGGIWGRATQVAGISHVLCKHYTKLKPDQATLGGLVHEIGALPILTFAETKPELLENIHFLDQLITKVSPKLSLMILRQWDFPTELQKVPSWMSLLTSTTTTTVDYVDVIIAAKIQSLENTDHVLAAMPWSQVPAFAKLGINTDDHDEELEDLSNEILEATAMLQGS